MSLIPAVLVSSPSFPIFSPSLSQFPSLPPSLSSSHYGFYSLLCFRLRHTEIAQVVVVVVGSSPLHFVLRTSLGLRNVNEVVEGVAYGRSLRVCDLEGSGGGC